MTGDAPEFLEPEPEPAHKSYPVFLATVGVFLLSMLNASMIAVVIALFIIGFDLVDLDALNNFEEKLRFVLEMKTVGLSAGVLGSSSALLVLGVAFVATPRSRISARLRLGKPNFLEVFLVSIGMLGFTHALGQAIVLLGFEHLGSLAEFNRIFEGWSFIERLWMLPVLALCPGIAEEIFFRGYALTKLELALGFKPAMLITAVLFGFIHMDIIHSVAAAGMGLYLAYVVRLTGSLWTTITAHILNNTAAVLFPDLVGDVLVLQLVVFVLGLATCGGVVFFLSRRDRETSLGVVW